MSTYLGTRIVEGVKKGIAIMGRTFTEIHKTFIVHSVFFHYNETPEVPSKY